MKKLRIYIVEDEPLIVMTIESMLKKNGFIVTGNSDNATIALKKINNIRPDLVLIDILLNQKLDGIDLALELDKIEIPYMYLTSQTDPKTIEKVKRTYPLGYLVKPFTELSLLSNIAVCWNNYEKSLEGCLVFKHENNLIKLNHTQILFLQAYDNYCYIVTANQKYLVPKTLKYTAQTLNPSKFIKSHRSYIVNLSKVEKISNNSLIIQQNSIPISRKYKTAILQMIRGNSLSAK